MGQLLKQKKYMIYDQIDNPTRSFMYKLCDHIEDITFWYAGLPASDKNNWKHPQAVAKHCPTKYLASPGKGHNKPPTKTTGKKKPPMTNTERSRRLRARRKMKID